MARRKIDAEIYVRQVGANAAWVTIGKWKDPDAVVAQEDIFLAISARRNVIKGTRKF